MSIYLGGTPSFRGNNNTTSLGGRVISGPCWIRTSDQLVKSQSPRLPQGTVTTRVCPRFPPKFSSLWRSYLLDSIGYENLFRGILATHAIQCLCRLAAIISHKIPHILPSNHAGLKDFCRTIYPILSAVPTEK